ncbi:hypothetical protein RND81_01G196000 [Saponaria officinalis]|uniref:Uncharacterized protein n=1 Tax=Saponaria officinalis TaxID=3572 RepID=A0AAW1NJQ4_SAPOF
MNFKIIPISENPKKKGGVESKTAIIASDVEILRKCLEENKGNKIKCKSKVEAFKFAALSPPKPEFLPSSRFSKFASLTDV